MNWLRTRIGSRLPVALTSVCAALLAFAAVGAVGALAGAGQPAGKAAHARGAARRRAHRPHRAPRAPRGPRGPRGLTGWRGFPGGRGAVGAPPTLQQSISINWEGSVANATGRETQSFVAPGIGYGQVTCSENTQWVWFVPYDQNEDVAMWTAKFQGDETTVRTARHTRFTGPSFYEGMNRSAGEQQSQGSFVGIIGARGRLGGSNGSAPAPTTFHLSWYWNFDPSNPRCFVAGTFISNGG